MDGDSWSSHRNRSTRDVFSKINGVEDIIKNLPHDLRGRASSFLQQFQSNNEDAITILELKEKIEKQDKAITEYKTQIENVRAENAKFKDTIDKLKEKNIVVKNKVEDVTSTNINYMNEIEKLRIELDKKDGQISVLIETEKEHLHTITNLNAEKKQDEQKIETLLAKIEQHFDYEKKTEVNKDEYMTWLTKHMNPQGGENDE